MFSLCLMIHHINTSRTKVLVRGVCFRLYACPLCGMASQAKVATAPFCDAEPDSQWSSVVVPSEASPAAQMKA